MTEKPTFGLNFRPGFFRDYMTAVEDSESPRLYHIWSAVSALSTALGRRCWLPFGVGDVLPNQYIVLVGGPAMKKSSAISFARKALKKGTGTRFIPSDTAGHRQGYLRAMLGAEEEEETQKAVASVQQALADGTFMGINFDGEIPGVTDADVDPDLDLEKPVHEADKHHCAIYATEFEQVLGDKNTGMMPFLTQMWDGSEYEYQTKTTKAIMRQPLLNMLGATTPVSLANTMPATASGQGVLSRFILVFGDEAYKRVARPKLPNPELVGKIADHLAFVYNTMHGAFRETPEAYAKTEELYEYVVDIEDSRFSYYKERRQAHLLKLGMAMAASRGAMEITAEDYDEAHQLLQATEIFMPEALGQFGLSPLAVVKQSILEFLRGYKAPVPGPILIGMFQKDARRHELNETIDELVGAKLVARTEAMHDGHSVAHYVAIATNKNKVDLSDFLDRGSNTNAKGDEDA